MCLNLCNVLITHQSEFIIATQFGVFHAFRKVQIPNVTDQKQLLPCKEKIKRKVETVIGNRVKNVEASAERQHRVYVTTFTKITSSYY